MKLLETDTILAFMDINPIAKGHCLVIPKREDLLAPGLTIDHAEKLTDLPDDQTADIIPSCRKLAAAVVSALRSCCMDLSDYQGAENYNILQVWHVR